MVTTHQIQDFLDARRHAVTNPERFQTARRALIANDMSEVLAHFETWLQLPDEEERARAIEGLALLYGPEAIDPIIHWINDSSATVRWVVCGCLHDFGDARATAALLDRLNHEDDCQVRGAAASALGAIGAVEVLPDLYQTYRTDHEIDPLGHSPSSQALDAMTSVLRSWASQQLQGTPPKTFRESTRTGQLTGTVTAEEIPFDDQGRINRTPRYSHVPLSAFGNGWMSKIDLQTSVIAPFEIEVEYVDPTCVIQRILIYHQVPDSDNVNWAVHTIIDTGAMKSPP